jgi:hypothetical protein
MNPVSKLKTKIWKKLPEDLKNTITQYYILNIYDNTDQFAFSRERICSDMQQFSFMNKNMFSFLNNLVTINKIINKHLILRLNLSSYDTAILLNTPGSRKYIKKSEELRKEFDKPTSAAISKFTPEKIATLTDDNKFNPSKIKALISEGADINCIKFKKKPILIKVINNRTKIKVALNLGANVNIAYYNDNTFPLGYAISTKNIPVIKLLLAHNPDYHHIPLAIKTNSSTIVKLLIEKGNLKFHEIAEGFYQSLLQKKIKLIPLFAQGDPNLYKVFTSSMQLTKDLKIQAPNQTLQRDIINIMKNLSSLSDEDFAMLST